jgi:gliding motility-associated-like protein
MLQGFCLSLSFAQPTFNYDAITICEGDSYDLLNYQTNEVVVPIGWEIVGWQGITNTTVTPTTSPKVYTLQYREKANPSIVYTHDLTVTLRPKPMVSITPNGTQVICEGQPIHIEKVSATNYDNLYWIYVQKGDKYYTDNIDATAVQGNIDNKMTYKLIATNNNCAVVAQAQMEYAVIRDDEYPIYRFYLSYNSYEGAPRLNRQINYCGTTNIATYMTPSHIVVSTNTTGDMAFDPYSDDRYTTLPTNAENLYISPNPYQKSENDMVKLTRYEVKWETEDQYTQGAAISGVAYTNKYTLEVDLYFKACGTTKTYYYYGELKLNPYCPVYDHEPWISYHCSEVNGQGQFGIQNPSGANTINSVVWENLTLPGQYLPQGTSKVYRYAQFDDKAPAQMTYRVTIDYIDENGVSQQMVTDRTFNTCYVKKQICYASAYYDYGFKPWLVYNGYNVPIGYEGTNYEGKTTVDTIETTVCLGSPAYLSIASNVKGTQNVIWRNSERPMLRTQYNQAFYDYSYNQSASGYELLIDSIPCLIFKVNPTKTTIYTGTLNGLEFAFKVNVVNNHIAAIDTAICRGQSIDLKTLERIDNINGTVAWNVTNTLVTPTVDTKYTVYGISRDICPNQADYTITDNVSIHVDEQLWSTAGEVSSCAGDRLDLKEFLNTNARKFKWYNASGDVLPDGIIKIEGDTYYTVEMSNGCGTKTDTIQVKETPACYDYEFAKSDSLSTAICATSGLNSGYPIIFAKFTVSPLINDGSPCDNPIVTILTQSTIAGTEAVYSSGKIFYDTSYENIINYSGQKDSVQYEVRCEFKRDTAWAYFEIRDEQVLSLSELKINTDGSEITLITSGISPSKANPISIGLITADGTSFYESVNLIDTTAYTFKNLPSFPDGKYYYFAYNLSSICIIEDSIELRNGQIVANGGCTSDTTRIDTTIFQGQSYTLGTKVYTTAVIDTLRLKNVTACDSIVILNLSVKPSDCSNGTLIFKEDFGGNQVTDDDIKATGIPQVSGYTYIGPGQTATTNRTYFIRKIGYGNGDWHRLDDHTYFNDYTRGYLLQVDASNTAGTFYKVTVNDVCPGTKLYFSAWAVNSMVLWRQNNLSATSPNISFVIKDAATNSVLLKYDTGNIPNDSTWYPADYSYAGWLRTRPFTANWMKYGTAFTVPSNVDSLIFTLENNTTAYTGADFALDDIEIHICVPPVNIQGDTVCVGEPLTLTGNFVNDGSFVEPLEYKWQKSITGKPLDTTSWIDVAGTADLNIPSADLTDQAYYRLLVASMGNTNKVSCRAASNSAFLKVNAIVDTLVHDSICQGDNYTFNGKQLSTEGIYKDTLISSFGCDSIVTLNLRYYKIDTLSVYTHPFGICEGDYTVFYGDTLRTQGIYYHTHSCDTVYKLQLLIKPRVNIEIQDSICRGNSYNFNGKTLLQSGVYADTIPSLIADLCDTLITLTLNYKKDIRNNIFKKICQGDSYNFEGTILNTNGTFTHQFPSTENRCDSILILHLMVMPPDTTYLTISITEGESFWFGGNEITTTGTYYNQLSNKLDCDSVVILNINIVTDNSITVPEIFTPNGDGNNDFFEILNIQKYPKNHILILNRWGNKVYEGKPYMNQWDGRNYFGLTVGGNELPVGTYFYILDLGDGTEPKKGYVYLNR